MATPKHPSAHDKGSGRKTSSPQGYQLEKSSSQQSSRQNITQSLKQNPQHSPSQNLSQPPLQKSPIDKSSCEKAPSDPVTCKPLSTSDAIHPNPDIAQRLKHIYRLNRKDIELRIEDSPYNVLLERLGNPHLSTPPIIHIAGTNGKGSTIAFLRSILAEAGYKTHAYTSPHLLTFNERIVLRNQNISDDQLLHALDHVNRINGDNPVTFFEYTTALAFYLFAKHKSEADFVLLETGMGGRLDCSNIIEAPLCTAITKIGYDHTEFLGDTIEKIAYEKACIMKQDSPCIIAPQEFHTQTTAIFTHYAATKNAPLIFAKSASPNIHLGLFGKHQYENAGTAIAIIKEMKKQGIQITDLDTANGLQNAIWKGRLEKIEQGKLYQQLHALLHNFPMPPNISTANSSTTDISNTDTAMPEVPLCNPPHFSLYMDGGHNISGGKALAQTLQQWKRDAPDTHVTLLLGMGENKNANAFLDCLAPHIDGIILMDVNGGMNPQSAAALYNKLAPHYQDMSSMWNNSENPLISQPSSQKETQEDHIFLLCGSLFLYNLL